MNNSTIRETHPATVHHTPIATQLHAASVIHPNRLTSISNIQALPIQPKLTINQELDLQSPSQSTLYALLPKRLRPIIWSKPQRDAFVIAGINDIIENSLNATKAMLRTGFNGVPPVATEGGAIHNAWVRQWFEETSPIEQAQHLIAQLTPEETRVGLTYLLAIEKPQVAQSAVEYERIQNHASAFINIADRAVANAGGGASWSQGAATRPTTHKIFVDDKFALHPTLAFLLKAFRSAVNPRGQKHMDQHLERVGFKAREASIAKMLAGPKKESKRGTLQLTVYELETLICIDTLPTQAKVAKLEHNGETKYLMKYLDYRTKSQNNEFAECYAVSSVALRGHLNNDYRSGLSFAQATEMVNMGSANSGWEEHLTALAETVPGRTAI